MRGSHGGLRIADRRPQATVQHHRVLHEIERRAGLVAYLGEELLHRLGEAGDGGPPCGHLVLLQLVDDAEQRLPEPAELVLTQLDRDHGLLDLGLQRLPHRPEAEIVALCDPSGESLANAKQRNAGARDLPEFSDYRQMLADVELDAVQISTPHTTHFEQIMACLDKGLHVLTEKPMVCTVEHAHQVIAKAKEADRILMISYQRHLQPTYRFVRDKVLSGEMGDIQCIYTRQDQSW